MYIAVTLNHFRAVQAWARAHGARARLDMSTFQLEIKCRNRYFTFHPLFQATVDGRFAHTGTLTPDVVGFGGWLPYRTYSTPLSTDKLLFKRMAARAGMAVPPAWPPGATPDAGYVVKRARGSFGYALDGPYRPGHGPARAPAPASDGAAPHAYVERFVEGRILKVWFWGPTAFFAHVHDYPRIVGDGRATARELVLRQLGAAGFDGPLADLQVTSDCLRYQGLELDAIVPEGRAAWFDYRYGRLFGHRKASATSDSRLVDLLQAGGDQVHAAGRAVAAALAETIPVPVMVTVDGVLDAGGTIWWLEMNTNSILPPDGYPVILSGLFGTAPSVVPVGTAPSKVSVGTAPSVVRVGAAASTVPVGTAASMVPVGAAPSPPAGAPERSRLAPGTLQSPDPAADAGDMASSLAASAAAGREGRP